MFNVIQPNGLKCLNVIQPNGPKLYLLLHLAHLELEESLGHDTLASLLLWGRPPPLANADCASPSNTVLYDLKTTQLRR